MEHIVALSTVATIWFVAVALPGPNLLITGYTAASDSRRAALFTVSGIATGTLFWASVGFLGFHLVLENFPALRSALELLGGSYLIYLGFRLLKSLQNCATGSAPQFERQSSMLKYYLRGVLTNIGNPKTAAFSASVFAAAAVNTAAIGALSIALMVCISFLWYSSAAILLSTTAARQWNAKFERLSKQIGATIFIAFGVILFLPA
ncbi:MAG: LysE family transporter [Pseudomonadota bacterium]